MGKYRGKGRNKEEVRLENPVVPLLRSYGVKIRGDRFVPFCHAADQLSGKILNPYMCFCHVCGRNLDCFDIVGHFEGIDKLSDRVKFLGGEEVSYDDPEAQKRREAAKKREAEMKAEAEKHKAFLNAAKDVTDQIVELKKFLRKNKPSNGEWPSKEWSDAYNKLQVLDVEAAQLLNDTVTGGKIQYILN